MINGPYPAAAVRLMLNDQDISQRIRPRLIELTLNEARADEADQLEMRLSDHDGQLAIPSRGARLALALGWQQRGLIDKGSYTVDEIEHSGAPDVLTLRARSTDLSHGARQRKTRSWHHTTLGAILQQCATDNALIAHISPLLAERPIAHLDQSAESDLALLTRLAQRFDAVGTIKSGYLLFAPIGDGRSASGTPLPVSVIHRHDGDQHRYSCHQQDQISGVVAQWHDFANAATQTITVGTADNAQTLPHTYASAEEAQTAARSQYQRLQRQGARLSLTLALGNPALYPEQSVQVRGFKPDIDGTDWLIVSTGHRLNSSGFTTELELEVNAESKAYSAYVID